MRCEVNLNETKSSQALNFINVFRHPK